MELDLKEERQRFDEASQQYSLSLIDLLKARDTYELSAGLIGTGTY